MSFSLMPCQNDREAICCFCEKQKLSRQDLKAAVFIGGMEGVEAEYDLFRRFHPVLEKGSASVSNRWCCTSTSRAAWWLHQTGLRDVDFARLFHDELTLPPEIN